MRTRLLLAPLVALGCALLSACSAGATAVGPSAKTTEKVASPIVAPGRAEASPAPSPSESPSAEPSPTPAPDPTTSEAPEPPAAPSSPVKEVPSKQFLDADTGTYEFVTPSGNLHCSIDTTEAQPTIGCQSDDPVENMGDCPDSPVIAFAPGREVATSCTSTKPFYGTKKVLEYGRSITVQTLTCESRSEGLTCRDRQGYGFTAARAGFNPLDRS